MNVYRTKVFRAGNSDALRLPKEVTPGPDVEMEIIKQGDVLTVRPVRKMTPQELVAALRAMPKPTSVEKRDKIVFPRRKGL